MKTLSDGQLEWAIVQRLKAYQPLPLGVEDLKYELFEKHRVRVPHDAIRDTLEALTQKACVTRKGDLFVLERLPT